jgi:hypothetical protein
MGTQECTCALIFKSSANASFRVFYRQPASRGAVSVIGEVCSARQFDLSRNLDAFRAYSTFANQELDEIMF